MVANERKETYDVNALREEFKYGPEKNRHEQNIKAFLSEKKIYYRPVNRQRLLKW